MCNESHLETFIESLLKNKNIKYIRQYRIFNILGYKSLDFYLPEYNIAIECQGIQHFKPIDYFGGTKAFNETINRDVEKYKSLNENKLNLIYIINKRNKKYLNDDIFRGIYDGNVFFLRRFRA